MAQDLTTRTDLASRGLNIEPQIVLCLDGVSTCYGSDSIKENLRIGDPRFFIGNTYKIGDLIEIEDQENTISIDGTSTRISQQLEPDRGAVSSVSSMTIRMVDFQNKITRLITPGLDLTDPLFVRGEIYLGFKGTAFPDDFIRIHAGNIDTLTSGAGFIDFVVSHPDQKKRQDIFPRITAEINGTHTPASSSIVVDDAADFIIPKTGDTFIKSYIRVKDEVIQVLAKSGNTFTSIVRGALGTTADSFDTGEAVESFYVLEGNVIELALRIMLSSDTEYFRENVEIESFVYVNPTLSADNAIFFKEVDVSRKYGLIIGDIVETSGATDGANNIGATEIIDIVVDDTGSYIQVDDQQLDTTPVSLVQETDTGAVIKFKSQFNTLTEGLGMTPEEVDVERHDFLRRTFFGSADVRPYIKDTVNGKTFIEEQLYLPFSLFNVPRAGRSSLSLHIGPLPTQNIPFLTKNNIKNPSKIRLKRTTTRNFYNTIIYKLNERVLEDDFETGVITINNDSLNRIKTGRKALEIEGGALRPDLQGEALAITASNRRLQRYKFAAESFDSVELVFGAGFNIDAADILSIEFDGLKVSNTEDGDRTKKSKLFEVTNRSIDLKTGQVSLKLVDTNFAGETRYCLMGPSSYVRTGLSTSQFIIEESFSSRFKQNEFRKYEDFIGAAIKVRSDDFTTQGDAYIKSIVGNTVTVEPALAFTPLTGYVIEWDDYDAQSANAPDADRVRLVYGFMNDSTFADGSNQYQMI